jgi:hypothetical protein
MSEMRKNHVHNNYRIYITSKKKFNPIHEKIHGREGGIMEATVGERGWLFYKDEEDAKIFYEIPWHRVHTSLIESVEQDESGNIFITTENTYYKLIKTENIQFGQDCGQ